MKWIDACKRHPYLALTQALTLAAMVWVGTTLIALNREVGELKVMVEILRVQVARLQ